VWLAKEEDAARRARVCMCVWVEGDSGGCDGGGGIAAAVMEAGGGGVWRRERGKKGAAASRRAPGPGLVNTATESLVFLSTAVTMDPQETKDERRAIYFGPLFPAA